MNLAIFDVTYIFDHFGAILDISLIQMTRTLSKAHATPSFKHVKEASGTTKKYRKDVKFSTIEHNANS